MSDKTDRESIWFTVLEEVVMLNQRKELNCDSWTNDIMKAMMRYVSLMSLMQWIIRDASGRKSELSNVKDMLLKMLDAYNYECTLFETTNSLLNAELHSQLECLVRNSKRAFSSRSTQCLQCKKRFADASIVVYKCSHVFHRYCSSGSSASEWSSNGSSCPKCSRGGNVSPEPVNRAQ